MAWAAVGVTSASAHALGVAGCARQRRAGTAMTKLQSTTAEGRFARFYTEYRAPPRPGACAVNSASVLFCVLLASANAPPQAHALAVAPCAHHIDMLGAFGVCAPRRRWSQRASHRELPSLGRLRACAPCAAPCERLTAHKQKLDLFVRCSMSEQGAALAAARLGGV